MKRSQFTMTAAIAAGIGITVSAVLFGVIRNRTRITDADDMAYHDVTAEYGTLTAGITRTAPLSVSVTSQIFDLDKSGLDKSDLGPDTEADKPAAALQVDEVLVSAGQQVQKGTALFRITADSAQRARSALQRKILETNRECELLRARQKELRLQASQGYDSEVMGGRYAGVVYSSKCDALQKRADEAKEAVDRRQDQVNENLLELVRLQQELEKAQKYLKDAQAAVDENYSERYKNAYYYTVYENARETAQDMVDQLSGQIESLTEKNDSLLYEVGEATRAYHQIVQDLEKEKLAAGMERDAEIYGSEMASEWYEIQTASLDNALQEAEERYQSALRDIRLFDACIVRNCVLSEHSGVLAAVRVEAGDTLEKNDTLVTLYDQENASMTVTLRGEEYVAVDQGRAVNISFPEYPDKVYEGRITDSFASKSDSEGDAYTVKVVIQGDTAGLGGGMTGEVTFLTDETKRVLCVPKRAVFTDGERLYVKMRRRNGTVVEKKVTTGFCDGIHIEIVKGISEGDVVLQAAD